MPQTAYNIPLTRVAKAVRKTGYARLADLLTHLDDLDIDLVSLNRKAGNLEIVLSDAVPEGQLDHLGLV